MPVDEMQCSSIHWLVWPTPTIVQQNDEKMRDTMLDFCDYFAELELKG
jgi:hypothetical protein